MAHKLRKLAAHAVVSLILGLSPALLAQTPTTGALTGRVSDGTNAVIPNASVQVVSKATGAQNTVISDQNGNFRFSLLAPGSYTVRFRRLASRRRYPQMSRST